MSQTLGTRGFSLIELLLSVTIIGILTGLSAPLYASFQTRNDLDITAQGIAEALRRAQTYARGNSSNSQWGVAIQGDEAIVFLGDTFATRTAAFDEITPIPGNLTASGLTEVRFTKLDAMPHTIGSITLTSNVNETRTITINAKGMVTY